MSYRFLGKLRTVIFIPLALLLLVLVACGSSATAIPQSAAPASKAPASKAAAAPTAVPSKVEKSAPAQSSSSSAGVPTATPQPIAKAAIPGISADPKRGGWVNMQAFESPGSDTYYGGNNADNTMAHIGSIFNQIVEFDPDTREGLDLRGGVAESWSISEDGLTYSFKLRDNLMFHDGTPLEMEDVLFTLTTAFTPDDIEFTEVREEIAGRTLSDSQTVATYLKDWEAVDPNTLAINVNFPTSAFLVAFGAFRFPVISKGAVAEHGTFKVPNEGTMVGTGPFMFVEYDKDIVTVVERNPNYHIEGRPYLDGIRHYPIFEAGTIVAAYKTEQVMMSSDFVSNLTVPDLVRLQEEMGDDKLRLAYAVAPPYSMGVMMNTEKWPFDDPRMRKAVNLALHRQPLIMTLSAGKNKMGTPIPCGFAWSFTCEEAAQMPGMRELNGEKHPDDIAEAQALALAVGAGPGTKLEFSCRMVIEYCDMMQIVKSQFQQTFGWELTTRSLESTAGYDLYRAGEYDFAIQAVGFPFPDADASAAAFRENSTSHTERTFYFNPDAEPLWAQINTETDFLKRKELVAQVNAHLMEDNSWAFGYHPTVAWPINTKIQNFIDPTGRSSYIQWDQIWCDECKK